MNTHNVVVPLMVCVAAIMSLTGCVGGPPACGSTETDKLALLSNCEPQEFFSDLSDEIGVVILGQTVEMTDISWVGAGALESKCVVWITRADAPDTYNVVIEERFGPERVVILNDVSVPDIASAVSDSRSQCS